MNELPPGLSPIDAASALPPGLSPLEEEALPAGLSMEDPMRPEKAVASAPVTLPNTEVPGFWQNIGKTLGGDDPLQQQFVGALTRPYQNTPGTALAKGLVERVAADAGGLQVLTGAKSLEQQYQEGKISPPAEDEIDNLLKLRVNDGWNDPKWWGAQIAHGFGSMAPGAAAGVVGSVAGPVGGAAGFGLEGSLGALIPAYKAARAQGLSPDDATTRALVDSGIAGATATAMGLAPGVSLLGRVADDGVGQVANMMKRPAMEALAQLGLVQPGLAISGELATALTHGETPSPWDLATTGITAIGMGGAAVAAHAPKALLDRTTKAIPAQPPATEGEAKGAFENTAAVAAAPLPEGLTPVTPSPAVSESAPVFSALEEQLYPVESPESRIFYSKLRQVVDQHLPESASVEQVVSTLMNKGVKHEEILDSDLPGYLASVDGRVNKKDLQAHLDANSLELREAVGGDKWGPEAERTVDDLYARNFALPVSRWPVEDIQALQDIENNNRRPQFAQQVLPGEHSNYREFVLKVPERGPRIESEVTGAPRGWERAGGGSETSRVNEKLNYESSHWEKDINPIAHFRVTDRADRDGRHLLHVEEIQSDLHQAGRKEGYRSKSDMTYEQVQELRRPIIEEQREIFHRLRDAGMADSEIENHPEFREATERLNRTSPLWRKAIGDERKLPDLPFKTSWPELVVKRILRLAADEGYDGVSWANGDQVGLRLGNSKQWYGAKQFYDKTIPSLFKKWAKKLGADTDTTQVFSWDDPGNTDYSLHPSHEQRLKSFGLDPYAINEVNGMVKVNPAFSDRVRMGFSLYDEGVRRKMTLSESVQRGTPKTLMGPGKKIIEAVSALAKDMTISRPLEIALISSRRAIRGEALKLANGNYRIEVNVNRLRTPEDVYATMGHELGHIIMWDKFASADAGIKSAVFDAYQRFRNSVDISRENVGEVRSKRDNAVSEMTGARDLPDKRYGSQNQIPLSDLQPKSRSYLLHFEEWFAEQVSKWAVTSDKPLSRIDRFFQSLGRTIRDLVSRFIGKGRDANPERVMSDWLDSMVTDMAPFAADIKDKLEFDTKRLNQSAIDRDGTPEVNASPQTASTEGGRNIINSLPPDPTGASSASVAHADRMNKFYEWMTSLPQIASMNKQIRGLTQYAEIVSTMNVEKNNIMSAAWDTLRQWKAIRDPRQQVALGRFIDDYMNGLFKDPSDRSGSIRRPTKDEATKLALKHGLSGESIELFKRVVKDFDDFLEGYRKLLLDDAARMKDPQRQLQAMEDINKKIDNMHQRPYMPAMRFGKYTITVYDSADNVKHFEQTESLRKQKQIREALEKSTDLLPGDRVRTGEVPKDSAPLLGMPPGLLDLMANKLSLSTTQRDMLDQLRFDYAPSQSFRHQFKTKDLTPGYSTDFQRAYANFFFHGANHTTRVKWVDALRDQIRDVKKSSIDLDDAVKRDRIANYMTEHLSMLVDPKPDFAALRGLMFHWYLGFNPASATLNLSQGPLMTYPHLASKFGGLGIGDLRAAGAMARASTEVNNFYKKGTLAELGKNAPSGPQGAKFRALAEAIREGVISETQAHTLAAVSENRNLLQAFGSKGEEAWNKFSQASSWMFEMTEQYNRRVAFRAAWDLAMRDPNNRYVSEQVRDNPLQYKRLRDQGWTHQEAAAFTAAKHSVEATQFVYAPYSRPKFMWGRKGSLFIFKSFAQNTLFNLYNNPAAAGRTLLLLGAVGGLMGLPGTEDINGILKGIAWHLFGKDFDLEDEARKFATDVLHGAISPDLLLHGTSVHGFGIPHVLHMMGVPAPVLDRHSSIGMGNILPFEPGKLLGPSKDPKGPELQQIQRASGAGFSLGFALYNFLSNTTNDLSSAKRWEPIMPRFMSNLSHAWRFASQGQETTGSGAAVTRFDMNDTMQMSEVLARAAGYQPRRLTAQYEAIQAKQEAATYWDLRQQILLRQFAAALKGGSVEEKANMLSAIKNYNNELPQEWKAHSITAQVVRESVMNKFRTQAKQELGIASAKKNIQAFKNMDKYFPDAKPPGLQNVVPVK